GSYRESQSHMAIAKMERKGMKRQDVRFALLMLALAFASLAHAGELVQPELGVVSSAQHNGFEVSAYPVLGRLPGGRLVCLFSARAAGQKKMKIAASVSDDGGRTWSRPNTVIDTPAAPDYDPSLIVDRDRILAFSTTVPGPQHISHSQIWISESKDGVRWSK